MTTEHPITPPPELVAQWWDEFEHTEPDIDSLVFIATQAARWGSDQELEACCHLLRRQGFDVVDDLRTARRPKPPSLKEQALEALKHAEEGWRPVPADCDIIRRALKRLQELEEQGDG